MKKILSKEEFFEEYKEVFNRPMDEVNLLGAKYRMYLEMEEGHQKPKAGMPNLSDAQQRA